MDLSHSIVHEIYHFQNVLLPSFTVGLSWAAFTSACLHLYAFTENRLLLALSRFELLGMYSAKVRWLILRILLDLAHALNTPECDLCEKEKPSPIYNWAVQEALLLYPSQWFPATPTILHKEVGTGNKSSKVHSLDGQGKGLNLLFVFDWQDSCLLPLVLRLRPRDEREVFWSAFSTS